MQSEGSVSLALGFYFQEVCYKCFIFTKNSVVSENDRGALAAQTDDSDKCHIFGQTERDKKFCVCLNLSLYEYLAGQAI